LIYTTNKNPNDPKSKKKKQMKLFKFDQFAAALKLVKDNETEKIDYYTQKWKDFENYTFDSKDKSLIKNFLDTKSSNSSLNLSLIKICMVARAFLEKPPIMVIEDEAFNFPTLETSFFYNAFWDHLKNTTIITILSNFENLMKYDEVIIFDKGKIVEQDSPITLLKNKESYLFSYIKELDKPLFDDLQGVLTKLESRTNSRSKLFATGNLNCFESERIVKNHVAKSRLNIHPTPLNEDMGEKSTHRGPYK
jgi:ABC-type multidrug transport system ATPase subunit